MNLETLKLYCDIVRLQSFSKGAKVNQVTQSAASQAIAQLEQDLGLQLIDRSKRPFALSPEGQKYYAGVRSVLSDYAKLVSEVKGSRDDIGGTVRVAAIYSVGLYDLSRYTQKFMSLNPQAKVRLEYLRPNKVYDAVVHEDVDLGIMSYPRADRAVTVLPWRFEKMVFVCNPQPPPGGKDQHYGQGIRRRKLHRFRSRSADPQSDRPRPEATALAREHRHGVRQHRDDEAGDRSERRRLNPARTDRATRSRGPPHRCDPHGRRSRFRPPRRL